MNTVEANDFYTVMADQIKNRLYLLMKGDVFERQRFENLPAQMREACRMLKPGFTCLADFAQVSLFALPDVATAVQKTLLEEGVKRVASVWGEQMLAKLSMSKSAQTAGDPYVDRRKVFTDKNQGEAWLDEP
ncbi:MAG: hypothetical protein V1792_11590 [Pseudomonadota bacterium]